MISVTKRKMIETELNIKFTFTDLFYAYCASKGIEDPENDENLTDEEYNKLEEECERKISRHFIRELGNAIMMDGMERINYIDWDSLEEESNE